MRGEAAVAQPLRVYLPVFVADARNATITDVDGNTFIDFAGGVGVCNVGHGHPRVVEAIQEQAARFVHTDFTVVPVPVVCRARRAAGRARPDLRPDPCGVLQLRRRGRGERRQDRASRHRPAGRDRLRRRVPRSHDARNDDDVQGSPLQDGDGARSPRRSTGLRSRTSIEASAAEALASLEQMFSAHVAPSQVAAIVFEPQLGEGGFVPAPAEFVAGIRADLRSRGDRHGRRRGPDGLRPHGADVRHGALRSRARPDRRSRSR